MPLQSGSSISIKKRLLSILFIFSILFFSLMIRVFWLAVVDGPDLTKKAYENQTRANIISPQRGIIYDRNGVELATSASVETVTVNPNEVKNNKKIKPEEIAQTLSNILQLDYNDVYKKITRNTYYEVIKRKIDKPVADNIRKEIINKKLPGISIIDDRKRVYSFGNFASNVIGFTGSDSQGLEGVERKYDKYLKGAPGRIISATDATGREIPFSNEEYIDPNNGNNVYLTIDEVIQHYTEKALEVAVNNSKVKKGSAIVMDPKTGEILALAVKPDYNLNEPFTPTDENMKTTWDTLDSKTKSNALQSMWRDPIISDTYEPGSTFKMVTSAAALELGVVKSDDMFNDIGYVVVANTKIKCWRADRPHGIQTFVQGVQNSCNPVFIEVGQRIGVERFYNYIKAFGFMEKTNIDLPGETPNTIFHKQSSMGSVDLAVYSFGQGFQVTPMQVIDAVSTVANGGVLLQPHIVKKIVDSQGNVVEEFRKKEIRTVISKETSKQLRDILESVVSEGTGSNAYIEGFRVAGKTGTSEKLPRNSGKYIASFGGFAPADDPKIAVLVILDEPTEGTYYGGQIAAPVVRQIIDDTLRYMNVEPVYSQKELEKLNRKYVTVPDVRSMKLNDGLKLMRDNNLKYKVEGSGEKILDQLPKPGYKVFDNSTVYIITDNNAPIAKKIVPDVTGKTPTEASKILSDLGLTIKINGQGTAVSQRPAAGSEIEIGSIVNVEFRNTDIGD